MLRASYSMDRNNLNTVNKEVFSSTGAHENRCLKEKGRSVMNVSTELFRIQRLYHCEQINGNTAFKKLEQVVSEIVTFESLLFGKFDSGKVDSYMYICSNTKDVSDFVYWNKAKNAASRILVEHTNELNRGELSEGNETRLSDNDVIIKNYVLVPTVLDNESLGFLLLVNTEGGHIGDWQESLGRIADAFALISLAELRLGKTGGDLDRKNKSELLDMLIMHSSDIIGVYDLSLMPKYLSPSVESILGFSVPQLMQPSFFEKLRKDSQDIQEVNIDGVKRYRYITKNKDGKELWLETIMDSLYDEKGEVQGYFGVTRNISEEVMGDQKMTEALEKEIALNKMKSQFISITSHEFKTPLSTIKSSIEICNIELQRQLEEHPSEQKFRKHFNRVNNEVDRMNTLLVNLLNLEKINQGVIQVTPKGKRINSYLHAVLEDWVDQGAVLFETALPEDFTHPIDVSLMNQVITNLVENALKYGSRDDKVLVQAKSIKDKLIISVKDYGDGIPRDEQKHLFKPFFRASNSSKYDKGSGLGLMITKKFIELQNGAVHFESKEGEGTCFYLTFPLI
ncbi:PAS domain-containing sensor histidine kinase [Echinicola soli]|nr:PAS domain-containing sensor histidine kinase [Echinicola soli]